MFVSVTPPHLATIACILFHIAIDFQQEQCDDRQANLLADASRRMASKRPKPGELLQAARVIAIQLWLLAASRNQVHIAHGGRAYPRGQAADRDAPGSTASQRMVGPASGQCPESSCVAGKKGSEHFSQGAKKGSEHFSPSEKGVRTLFSSSKGVRTLFSACLVVEFLPRGLAPLR